MKSRCLSVCMATLALLVITGPLSAKDPAPNRAHTQFVVFGDSLSDPGNYFAAFHEVSQRPFEPVPDAPYAMGGMHYSNGDTWIEQLGHDLQRRRQHRAGAATRRQRHQLRGRPGAGAPGSGGVSTLRPVDAGRHVPRPDRRPGAGRRALRPMDRRPTTSRTRSKALPPIRRFATATGIIQQAVGTTAGNMQALWNAGARRFLLVDMPDLAITPYIIGLGPVAQYAAGRADRRVQRRTGPGRRRPECLARHQHHAAST